MMKRLISMVMVLIVFMCVPTLGVAEDVIRYYTSGEFEYHLYGDEAVISGVSPKSDVVTIPGTLDGHIVMLVESSTLSETPFSRFEVASDNKFFEAKDGVLYERGCKTLVKIPTGYKGKFVIPDGVEVIASYAFYDCDGLTAITFPKSLKRIESGAFNMCDGLKKVELPENLEEIEGYAFANCKNLKNVVISDNTYKVANGSFAGTPYEEDADNWDNGVLYIGNHLVWNRSFTGEKYTIREGTVSISKYAFLNSETLTEVYIPDGVRFIGSSAFSNCANLLTVRMPENGCEIENNAFKDAPCIGNTGHWECGGLYLGKHLISTHRLFVDPKKGIAEVIEGTLSIASGAINVSSVPYEIVLPSTLSHVSVSIFGAQSTATGFRVHEDNSLFAAEDGILYDQAMKTLIVCAPKFEGDVTVKKGVTKIKENAFGSCKTVTSVGLPSSLLEIGKGAFKYCTELKSIDIPDKVKEIDEWVFYGCAALEKVRLPKDLEQIKLFAFLGIDIPQIFEMPYGLQFIDDSAGIDKNDVLYVYSNSFALDFAKTYDISYKLTKEAPKKESKPIASKLVSKAESKPVEDVLTTSESEIPSAESQLESVPAAPVADEVTTPTQVTIQTATEVPTSQNNLVVPIVVGAVALLVAVVGVIWWLQKRKSL